jgi:hypothetical protein
MSNRCGIGRATATDAAVLPPERAFVVEFSSDDATARAAHLSGRVEHVVSGQAARFESAGELLEFVQGVMRSRKPTRKKVLKE